MSARKPRPHRSEPPKSGTHRTVRTIAPTDAPIAASEEQRLRWVAAQETDEAKLRTAVEMIEEAFRQMSQIVVDARHVREEAKAAVAEREAATILRIMGPYLHEVSDRIFEQTALTLESLLVAREEVLDVMRRHLRPIVGGAS